MRALVFVATLAAIASGGVACAAAAADLTVPIFDLSAAPESQAASYVKTAGRMRSPATARVAVVSFVVEFVDSHATTSAKPVHVAIELDRDQLQPIVDTLFDSVVENLRTMDTVIVGPADADMLAGHASLAPYFAGAPGNRESSDEIGKRTSLIISAHARPALLDDQAPATLAAQAAASRLDGVTLVSVHLVVDFLLPRRKQAPAYAQVIRAMESRCHLARPDGSAMTAVLRQSVRAPLDPIARGKAGGYDNDDDVDAASDIERLAVDAAVYYDQALRYLDATQDMMIAALGFQPANTSSRQAPSSGK
ncbi:MAG TPA: hypothetical protein VE046_04615 [Steroidobacteraceae bacterium]|nr:hypothetical protein [Steroidobacteraceae bacterium]